MSLAPTTGATGPNALMRGMTKEDTGLSTILSSGAELTPTGLAAQAQFEIQGAIVLAKRFPRNEDDAYASLQKSCCRPAFAARTTYCYPRGNTDVIGPSVYIAREAARLWGNIRYGFDIVSDDDDMRHIRGWAWDLETNTKVNEDASFRKLVQRKGKNGAPTTWIKPDERDLRELTNRQAAKAVRNCILQLIPKDIIDDSIDTARKCLEGHITANLDDERRKIVMAFSGIGVSATDLEEYLGHKLAQASPTQVSNLRGVFASIRDGNSTWSDYVTKPEEKPKAKGASGPVTAADLTGSGATGATGPSDTVELPQPWIKAINDAQDEEALDVMLGELEGTNLTEPQKKIAVTLINKRRKAIKK